MSVSCDPLTVGESSATLTLLIMATKTQIPANGFIKITVPSEANLVSGSKVCSITGDVT